MDHCENAIQDTEERRENSITKQIQSIKASLEEEASALSESNLRTAAEPNLIDNICAQTFTREFAIHMITRGTFNDIECEHPTFKYASQVKKLRGETMEELATAHYSLLVDPEEIKN